MKPTVVFFEDQYVDRLRPINLARPTYAVTCGAFSHYRNRLPGRSRRASPLDAAKPLLALGLFVTILQCPVSEASLSSC